MMAQLSRKQPTSMKLSMIKLPFYFISITSRSHNILLILGKCGMSQDNLKKVEKNAHFARYGSLELQFGNKFFKKCPNCLINTVTIIVIIQIIHLCLILVEESQGEIPRKQMFHTYLRLIYTSGCISAHIMNRYASENQASLAHVQPRVFSTVIT